MYYSFNSNLLPKITCMNICRTASDWIHPRRCLSEYVLLLITEGMMYIEENKHRYTLRAGDYLFLTPEWEHFGYQPSACTYYYIHFQKEVLRSWDCSAMEHIEQVILENHQQIYRCDNLSNDLYERYQLFLPKDRGVYTSSTLQQLELLMNEAISLGLRRADHYKLACSCKFIEILILLSHDFAAHTIQEKNLSLEQQNSHKIYELMDFIHNNYFEKITGDMISEKFDMNFDYLNRLFKQQTSTTVFEYLKTVRIDHARELLLTSHLKNQEISDAVGFCDQYYFSRVFKQVTGMSPSAYRRDAVS